MFLFVYVLWLPGHTSVATPNPPKKDKQLKDQKLHGVQLERTMVNSAPVFGKFMVIAL